MVIISKPGVVSLVWYSSTSDCKKAGRVRLPAGVFFANASDEWNIKCVIRWRGVGLFPRKFIFFGSLAFDDGERGSLLRPIHFEQSLIVPLCRCIRWELFFFEQRTFLSLICPICKEKCLNEISPLLPS